jgi:hypothetical protein
LNQALGVAQRFKITVEAGDKWFVANENTHFDIFSLCGFGEVGGGYERNAAIHNYTFGCQNSLEMSPS